ncbi:MAG: hypothetical protein AB7O52_07850 [Planctomycetota bacterium]
MAKVLEYNAVLARRMDLTPTLSIFQVKPDVEVRGEGPWFVPGQYMVIGLNHDDPELAGVQRPMSLASAPEERRYAEFYIRFVSQPASTNPFTHLMWPLAEGARMYMRPKPAGKFTLADTVGEEDGRLLVFVSAGTGLAPFVSIVRSFHNRHPQASLARFAILHGASHPADLGYRDELLGLAKSHGLRYIATVSRPQAASTWTGCVGRVEDLFIPERLPAVEEQLGLRSGTLTPANAVVFVCGLQGTIGRTVERLTVRGFVPDNGKIRRALEVDAEKAPSLYFEQYDTEPVIDLADAALLEQLRANLRNA